MKRLFFVLIFFILYNLIFFNKLFYPDIRLIITPQFGGGDTVNFQIPLKKILCDKLKLADFPFWNKKMSLGYPLFAEGEIGALNPINLLTCLFFDYTTAYNLQILLHTIIGNLGMVILAKELGFSLLTGIYLGLIFPYLPLIVMNYLQISLVYPLFFLPYIMVGVFRIIKKELFSGSIFITTAVFFQFLVSHFQVSFISFLSTFIFLVTYLFIFERKKESKKNFLLLTIFILSWVFGFLLAGGQTLPTLHFARNSNRLLDINGSFANIYDQNLNWRNFLTLINPNINGHPKNGTYLFDQISHPWEGNIFIFYIPLIFLIFSFFKNKNKIYLSSLITFFVILLIALGKNSPLYFIHGFPIFSTFGFPSRFLLTAIFYLVLLSAFGFESFIKNKNKLICLIPFLIIFFEAYNFFYDFHVFYPADKLYQQSLVFNYLKKNKKLNSRIYIPEFENFFINKKYLNQGYYKEADYYYHYLNDYLLPNVNLVYNIASFTEKAGPILSRKNFFYSGFNDLAQVNLETKTASFSARVYNKLAFSAVDYIITSFEIINNDNFVQKVAQLLNKNYSYKINIYKIKNKKPRVNFYDKFFYIDTVTDFNLFTNERESLERVILDSSNRISLKNNNLPLIANYKIIIDQDHFLKLKVNVNKEVILVVADNYYPEWEVYINNKKTALLKANFLYQGVIIPKGNHIVEFKYSPKSFYYGVSISFLTALAIILIIVFQRRHLLSS